MSNLHIKERLEQLRLTRDKGKVLRPLDDDDREALAHLRLIAEQVASDGSITLEEILLIGMALDVFREARSNTPR